MIQDFIYTWYILKKSCYFLKQLCNGIQPQQWLLLFINRYQTEYLLILRHWVKCQCISPMLPNPCLHEPWNIFLIDWPYKQILSAVKANSYWWSLNWCGIKWKAYPSYTLLRWIIPAHACTAMKTISFSPALSVSLFYKHTANFCVETWHYSHRAQRHSQLFPANNYKFKRRKTAHAPLFCHHTQQLMIVQIKHWIMPFVYPPVWTHQQNGYPELSKESLVIDICYTIIVRYFFTSVFLYPFLYPLLKNMIF